MLTINLGPVPLAVPHVLLMGSMLLAMLTGWLVGRRDNCNPERYLFRLLFIALAVARLAFVLAYLEHFREQPWRVVDIRDGGFIVWPGMIVAVLYGAWLAWRKETLRTSLGFALAAGVLIWGSGSYVLHTLERGMRLPEMSLRDDRGQPVSLQELAGKPLVVNLWATWCPPCRREMPVLAAAQASEPDITFVFVNQGESEQVITGFLGSEQLDLDNVLLDTGGQLGQLLGSAALPTTLYYDSEGRQIGSHLGELSSASLARSLEKLKKDNQP